MNRRLTRRQLVKAGMAGAMAPTFLARRADAANQRPAKPNLLFIMTDEQRFDTLAAYGNKNIHAPNLNKLADRSVVFQRAYVTQPVCTPSRSAMMTGLWPHTNGCIDNAQSLKEDTPCLPEMVNDPAYRTGYLGKWHLGDEVFAQHGFEEWASIEDFTKQGFRPGRDPNARSGYHHFLVDKGYRPGPDNKFDWRFASSLPIDLCKPKFIELKACEFLQRHRHDPFTLYLSFLEPHSPFFGPLDKEHDPSEIYLPDNFNDPLEENEPLRYRLFREWWSKNREKTEEDFRELIRRYWGLVTQVDRSVGAVLATLENLGLADNTIVVFTSDHGDMMGAHRLVAKSFMYEESVRVPWLFRVPWMQTGPRSISAPVSHIDLIPTLLELLGAERPTHLQGQSLVPLMRGERVAEDHVFVEWNGGALYVAEDSSIPATNEEIANAEKAIGRTVVSPDGWKLCLRDLDKSQLFNLREDPGETVNLFDSGRHDEVIRGLTEKIRDWRRKTDDRIKPAAGRVF